jgi:hypothetical protein
MPNPGHVVASVMLGAAVNLALLIIAQQGRPTGTLSISVGFVLLGPVLVAAVQSAVAVGLWWAKTRED